MTRRLAPLFMAAAMAVFPVLGSAAPCDYPPPWPAADVTFTVPYSRGSELDALYTLIKQGVEGKTGKRLEARHVPGRAGADAWARLVDDAPDGTVLTAVVFPDVYLRTLQKDSGVSLAAMSICQVVASMPCVLWAAGPNTVTSLEGFADAAAGRNGAFIVAGPGSYGGGQLASRMLDRELGVRTTYIPYEGTVTAAKAALDGNANAFWGFSVPIALPGVPAEQLKPLAVAAERRLPNLPDVPTFRELGIELLLGVHIGIAVPVDTPEITRQELDEFFSAFVTSQSFISGAVAAGFAPMAINADGVKPFLGEMETDARRLAESYDVFVR